MSCLHIAVDPEIIARGTVGFSGAELENLVNQAALKAAVDGKEMVTMKELEFSKDKILMGRFSFFLFFSLSYTVHYVREKILCFLNCHLVIFGLVVTHSSFFLKGTLFYLFIYFWLCWVFVAAWAFSRCGERGLLFIVVRGLLIAVASLVAEHGL